MKKAKYWAVIALRATVILPPALVFLLADVVSQRVENVVWRLDKALPRPSKYR